TIPCFASFVSFNAPATTPIYTLSLHDALPICIQSVTEFQPVIDSRPIQRVMGVRITLAVDFVETSQQFEGEAMDLLSVNVIQARSEEHTSELQSRENLVCRLLLEKKKKKKEQR